MEASRSLGSSGLEAPAELRGLLVIDWLPEVGAGWSWGSGGCGRALRELEASRSWKLGGFRLVVGASWRRAAGCVNRHVYVVYCVGSTRKAFKETFHRGDRWKDGREK